VGTSRRYGLVQPAMSDAGLMDVAGHEAIVLSPYWDSVHVLSWGMGHTRAALGSARHRGERLTIEKAGLPALPTPEQSW